MIRGLTPVVRYWAGRQAYVLRGFGGRFGPVLVRKQPEREAEYAKHPGLSSSPVCRTRSTLSTDRTRARR